MLGPMRDLSIISGWILPNMLLVVDHSTIPSWLIIAKNSVKLGVPSFEDEFKVFGDLHIFDMGEEVTYLRAKREGTGHRT